MIIYCINKNIELLIDYKDMFFKNVFKLMDIVLLDKNCAFKITQYERDV